jgi:plastocyanin
MRLLFTFCFTTLLLYNSQAKIHVIQVWDGYFKFANPDWAFELEVELGDTIQWRPLDMPMMVHTVTSTDIPEGAETFDVIWQAPDDIFFQYIPTKIGTYNYECTPHAESYGMHNFFTVVEPVLSTQENENLSFEIFPNPTSDILKISNATSGNSYQIYNQLGEEILNLSNTSEIDISHLPEGIYFISQNKEALKSKRFIINRN